MGLILCIETATEVCSVALAQDQTLLGIKESSALNIHSAILTVFIDEIIKSSGFGMGDLDAIAVSMGPGSYTGLRIGVATAKGLCYALNKPLIAIPTLQAMAAGMNDNLQMTNDKSFDKIKNPESQNRNPKSEILNPKSQILFCPMIDARRMEVYNAVFDQDGKEVREVRAEIIDEYSFLEFLSDHVVVFGGEGADKCKPLLGDHPNALFIYGSKASSRFMIGLAYEKFRLHQFENLAYFEPFYLKDFVAGKPRVKGLN
jgi:tRNA threonylcarbamoyladenosine biosynthesis protein TsaB